MTSTFTLLSPTKGLYNLESIKQLKQFPDNSEYKQSPLKPATQAIFDSLIDKYTKCLALSIQDPETIRKSSKTNRRKQSFQISKMLDKINISPKLR